MTGLLDDLAKKNEKLVTEKVNALPRRFERASLRFYPSVLKVQHGRLKRSFKGFMRKSADRKFDVGERSDVEYAAVHEYGFDGMVNVKAHARKGGKYGYVGVKAHTRHMKIREKKFFRTPIMDEAEKVIEELKKEIGF